LIIGKHFPGDESIEYTSPWYVSILSLICFYLVRCYQDRIAFLASIQGAKHFISNKFHRAGAHWRSHAPETDSEQQKWDMETYKHWLEVIEAERQHPGRKLLSGLAVSQSLCFVTFVFTTHPSRSY
jgi:D-amino-acid oxidase